MYRENAWKTYDEENLLKLEQTAKNYRHFLDNGKTERECVTYIVNEIEDKGYVELAKVLKEGKKLKAGDKVYINNMDKAIALFLIGDRPLSDGMKILGAHIDSPRLDVKQNPLYEDGGFAYLDTHY